jgi:ADP-heptose:LPS heptosyltransferase
VVARVLVLRALGLGDFLTGVPAYRALRRAFPSCELLLAAPPALAPLLPAVGALDRLLPAAELAPVPWSGPPPELAVNLHGRGPRSTLLLRELRPRRLVAFGEVAWDQGEHEVRRWCRLLGSAGIPADPYDLLIRRPQTGLPQPEPPGTELPETELPETELPETELPGTELPETGAAATGAAATGAAATGAARTVLVHPGAAAAARRWPASRYAAVAGALAADGWTVRVTGSPDEAPLATAVAAAAGLPREAVLAGRTDLPGLLAAVADAALVVCGDTGVGHLATALRTPSVLLFGPTPPALWGPLVDPERHTVLWTGRTGDPHGARTDPGLLELTAPAVMLAVRAQLARLSRMRGGTRPG